MDINIASININGLNMDIQQKLLHQFIVQHRLDAVYLQEHNIKEDGKVEFLEKYYHVILNKSINLKGGTCILIKRTLNCEIERTEMSADSRIISTICKLQNKKIHLLNIYTPSGNNLHRTREDFFEQDLPYYMGHNTSNTFMGGDFNSVISANDISNKNSSLISKTFLRLMRQAKLIDAWWIHNSHMQYTFVRQNYGSRIDRFYCNNRDNINNSQVIHCSFSDHSAIKINVTINENITIGKSYWKLNTSLLEDENIKENFEVLWGSIKNVIYNYENELMWWELCVKPQIKAFFIKEGKRKSKEKYGLIEYLEDKLKRLYTNSENGFNYHQIKATKDQIDKLKKYILEGVQIR